MNVNPEWLDTGARDAFNAEPDLTAYMLRHGPHAAHAERPLYSIEGTAGLVPLFADRNRAHAINYIHIPNLPKCDGAIYIAGDSMYPLLKSGDIVLYKQLRDLDDIFWGDMYLLDRHRRRGVHHREVHPEVGAPGLRETREPEPPPCGTRRWPRSASAPWRS